MSPASRAGKGITPVSTAGAVGYGYARPLWGFGDLPNHFDRDHLLSIDDKVCRRQFFLKQGR
jgi:hypothetical protein